MHPATRQSDTQRHLARIRELATDNKSLTARNAQLLRAANGPVATAHLAVVHGEAQLAPTLRIANALEEQGRVPVVRWARDANRKIVGIELATVLPQQQPADGMACEAAS